MTTSIENQKVLDEAKSWFKSTIIEKHIKNTKKLSRPSEFNINPFLTPYLSHFFNGEVTNEGVASVLVIARCLGQSITTSFGQNLQSFISDVLVNAYGEPVQGVDISFIDKLDGRKKYAQLKLGPNTINKDDVKTIHDHFKGIKNLARTNNLKIEQDDLIIGVLSGENEQLSSHYKKLRDEHYYPVLVGNDFWERLTGDNRFMNKLSDVFRDTYSDVDGVGLIDSTIKKLAKSKKITEIVNLKNNN
jgi:hypothetical protein